MKQTGADAGVGDLPDEELMSRYAAGDPLAFEALFRRYDARAYGFFRRRIASADRASDLHQELFLRIHRARDRYDPARPFAPWFFQIAHRLLVDDCRRAFRRHEVALEGPALRGATDDRMRFAVRGRGERAAEDREQVAQLLGGLSQEERYVVLAAKVEGVGYPELAEQLGKSVSAVKKLASRAFQRMRNAADSASDLRVPARLPATWTKG